MTLTSALHAFFSDLKLQAALVVIFADFVLGVLAAWHRGNFRLSYLADFGRNDIAFKLAPWLTIYIGAKLAGHQQLLIPGIDLGTAATAIYVVVVAAWLASIASSLTELGLPGIAQKVGLAVAGNENSAPPKD